MTSYVDPQHIEVITAKAREEAQRNLCALCGRCHHCGGYDCDEQCLAHLVLGLLRPSVTAFEPPL
jgi:hypothetical protein